jgi:hypothetical protein
MENRLKKQKYSIFVVDDKDWLDLHKDLKYMTKEKLEGALGFANPETMEAYVRKTGVADIDDITMEHELEELLATVSPHEVDGIRYKNFFDAIAAPIQKNITQPISNFIGSTLNRLGGVGKFIGDMGFGARTGSGGITGGVGSGSGSSNIGAGAGSYTTPVDKARGTGNIDELLGKSQPSSGLAEAFRKQQGQEFGEPVTLGSRTANISSSGGELVSTAPSIATNFGGGNSFNLLGNTQKKRINEPNIFSTQNGNIPNDLTALGIEEKPKLLGGISSAFNAKQGIATTPFTTPTAIEPTTPTRTSELNQNQVEPAQTLGSKLGKGIEKFITNPENLLGVGSLAMSAMQKQPEYQEPASIGELRNQLKSGIAPTKLGSLAQGELSRILTSTPTDLYPVESDAYYQSLLRRTRDSYATAKQNLDAQYNQAGVYGSGEHLAAVAKLQQELTNAEADLYAQTENKNQEMAMAAKYQAIQSALGVDKETMDNLIGLSGLDVQSAALKYGASVEDIQKIREALGTLGTESLKSGMA